VVLHLPCRLVACLHAVDGFTGGTLKTAKRKVMSSRQRRHDEERRSPSLTHLPSLLPLLYMATRHWKWYWCPHCASRPTDSARDIGPTPGPLYPDGPPSGSIQMVQSWERRGKRSFWMMPHGSLPHNNTYLQTHEG